MDADKLPSALTKPQWPDQGANRSIGEFGIARLLAQRVTVSKLKKTPVKCKHIDGRFRGLEDGDKVYGSRGEKLPEERSPLRIAAFRVNASGVG